MTGPAAARGREVRQRLLAAAVELIPLRGWTAVSTRVLAERAGVTPSVVHYHFPSMPALLNEAAVGQMQQMIAGVEGLLETARTPIGLADALLESVGPYSGADPMSLLFVEAYLASSRDEQLARAIAEILRSFRERLTRWLDEHGVAEPAATAAVLAATVDGLLLHRGVGAAAPMSLPVVLRRLMGDGEPATSGRSTEEHS